MAPWFPARRLRSLCHDSGAAPKAGTSKAEQLRLEEELVKTRAAKMKKLNEDFQAVGIFTQSMSSFSAFFWSKNPMGSLHQPTNHLDSSRRIWVFLAKVRVKPWFGNSHFLGIEKMETDIFPRWWSNHEKWGYHNQRMSKLDDKPTGMELIIYKRSKHRLIKQDLTQCPCQHVLPFFLCFISFSSFIRTGSLQVWSLGIFPVVPFLRELPGFVRSVGDQSLFGRLEIASVEAIADAAAWTDRHLGCGIGDGTGGD